MQDEWLMDGVSRVHVWLKRPPHSEGGLLATRGDDRGRTLEELCVYLFPALSVNLQVKNGRENAKQMQKQVYKRREDESKTSVDTNTLLAIWCFNCPTSSAQLLKPQDVNKLPTAPADHRIRYGSDPVQFADLRLPKGKGPFPIAVVIHGGCWMKFADLQNTAPMSDALRHAGIATWNIEYRRVDNTGGGWPGTFNDVAAAVDHSKTIAKTYER